VEGWLLLEAFEEEELFLCGPVVVVEGEVESVDHVVFCWVLIEVGEAAEAVIRFPAEHLRALGDVSLALVALDLVGRIEDVLNGERDT
jgi:hypothetical protein